MILFFIFSLVLVLTTFPNTSKIIKNHLLYAIFSTLFPVFGNVIKHGWSFIFDILHNHIIETSVKKEECKSTHLTPRNLAFSPGAVH